MARRRVAQRGRRDSASRQAPADEVIPERMTIRYYTMTYTMYNHSYVYSLYV